MTVYIVRFLSLSQLLKIELNKLKGTVQQDYLDAKISCYLEKTAECRTATTWKQLIQVEAATKCKKSTGTWG